MAISQISYAADKIKDTWAYLETILPATYNELNRVVKELVANNNNTMSTVLATIYPVGTIYMSVNSTSPATLFGGTWVQLKDRFLLGAGYTYTNGATGGEANHTLTANEMPVHKHDYYTSNSNDTAHFHTPDRNGLAHQTNTGGSHLISEYGSNNLLQNAGAGWAHNNMPPYLVVYMWKRTA